MKKTLILLSTAAFLASCSAGPATSWTEKELETINSQSPVMRVFIVGNQEDSLVLRTSCQDLNDEDLKSGTYAKLEQLMVSTVTSPEQDGVGIAGPQVGISRRIVAVQRMDKDGEPFEVYPNIRIIERRGEKKAGAEGCLSVPGERGIVMRWQDIDIEYTSVKTLKDTVETIQGFTAVIFQHETDHLDGILYTDIKERQ